ncbi:MULTISPECIES: hypothetical protein [unclassified Brevundimonas]|uniref:hypothetical protein n=1 Tax=unclassified Brevundimonas TaxID=2622653 RepID=UPI003F925DC7
MIALALAVLLSATPVQDLPAAQAAPGVEDAPVRLEDVEVTGRSLESMIDDFVGSVAAPNPNRSLARWRGKLCIGAAHFEPETAQYLVDRVSTVASDLGLRTGAPGCSPNVLIIAASDANSMAAQMTQDSKHTFRMGGSGMDRGGAALGAFQSSNQPVRWWQVSMPVDAVTGERVTRIPGECQGSCESVYSYVPVLNVFASRLSTQIVDDIFRTIVVVDANQLANVQIQQLADYIAMVTFAQIDPKADTSRYASILNVFDAPESVISLTEWDKAYLAGLYDTQRTRKSLSAARSEITSSIQRTHERLRAEEQTQD